MPLTPRSLPGHGGASPRGLPTRPWRLPQTVWLVVTIFTTTCFAAEGQPGIKAARTPQAGPTVNNSYLNDLIEYNQNIE